MLFKTSLCLPRIWILLKIRFWKHFAFQRNVNSELVGCTWASALHPAFCRRWENPLQPSRAGGAEGGLLGHQSREGDPSLWHFHIAIWGVGWKQRGLTLPPSCVGRHSGAVLLLPRELTGHGQQEGGKALGRNAGTAQLDACTNEIYCVRGLRVLPMAAWDTDGDRKSRFSCLQEICCDFP